MNAKHLTIRELSDALGISVRTIRTLTAQRKLPVIRLGHRTIFYRLDAAVAALGKFEVEAVR
jgi:excisionase family DNA binding protein